MKEIVENSPVIRLSRASVAFGGRRVLDGLDLAISTGESFGILGPSAGGKSVLLKLIAGLIRPTEGEVRFQGADFARLRRAQEQFLRRRIGMTFQRSGLFDSLSCGENLDFPLRELTQLSPEDRAHQVAQSLADVGLPGTENLAVHEMSGGMQKRLSLARALVLQPEVLLCDDPTAGLDPITSRAILKLIFDVRRGYDITLVLVTSDPAQTRQVCDRFGFLHHGTFLQVGTFDELRDSKNPAVKQFMRGSLEGPLTEEVT